MKKIFLSIVVLSAIAFSINASAMVTTKGNFSGIWTLDKERSSGVPPGMDQTMTVTHEGDSVKIETTLKGEQGEQVVPDSYTLDGKEKELERGTAKGKRTSKWTADGNGFEVTENVKAQTQDGGEVELQTTRKWTLATDGKTLTIEMTVKGGPQGEQQLKRTFIKK
jgi:hypothetical protein